VSTDLLLAEELLLLSLDDEKGSDQTWSSIDGGLAGAVSYLCFPAAPSEAVDNRARAANQKGRPAPRLHGSTVMTPKRTNTKPPARYSLRWLTMNQPPMHCFQAATA
jgi:hypothetical protein